MSGSGGKKRSKRGTLLLELVSVMFVFPIFTLVCVNVGVLIFAAGLNEAACREAARAAAQQSNYDDARAAAIIACRQYALKGGLIGDPKFINDGSFKFETFPDADGKPQIRQGPYVQVSTMLTAKLPAPIIFGDAAFTDDITFRQTYIFPILNPNQKDTGKSITVPVGDAG